MQNAPQELLALIAASRADPFNAAIHNEIGLFQLRVGNPAEAEKAFRRCTDLAPNLAGGWHHLALAYQRQGKYTQAIEAYKRRLTIEPQIDAYEFTGRLLLAVGDKAAAIPFFEQGYELEPTSAKGLMLRARVQVETEDFEGAEVTLEQVIREDPSHFPAYEMLGIRYQESGKFLEAIACFDKAIEFQPLGPMPHYRRLMARKAVPEDLPQMEHLEQLIERRTFNREGTRYLHYGLGKAFDDLKRYDLAIRHFDEANRISRETLHAQGREVDLGKVRRDYQRVASVFTEEAMQRLDGDPSELPVFIVGMMRSGTTLVERIIASHSEAAAGGELSFWSENGWPILQRDDPLPTKLEEEELASMYLKELAKYGLAAKRVTDKMPPNYVMLGYIRSVFPNARIIHCRRNPVDTCLSIYMTPNHIGNEKAEIVEMYMEYLKLMAHWRKMIGPDRMLEVDYEELVANPEPMARKLIEFVGLRWEDRCLAPEVSPGVVRTPSLWQVRQPVYRSSMNRWMHYEPWLGAFAKLKTDLSFSTESTT